MYFDPEKKEFCIGYSSYLLDYVFEWLQEKFEIISETCDADVAQVRHGKWEDEHGGKYANQRYRCSVCKERALYKFERDLLGNWKEVQALTPNCPNCGAKMNL